MAAFQDTRKQTEKRVMMHLLSEIDRNPSFTQRDLASTLGIALGLMNQYLKSSVSKGWIRATQVSSRRIKYFLTPEGFKEKSHMVKGYLARSLTFFRDAKTQCEAIFIDCHKKNWTNIALVGEGDLADIAQLVIRGTQITASIVSPSHDLKNFDAVLITDVINPQEVYDALHHKIDQERLLILDLLHISKSRPFPEK